MVGSRMSRRSLFISLGIIFAFGVCAINFAILARRTASPKSSSSISSSRNEIHPELALDLPAKEEGNAQHNHSNNKSGDSAELTLEPPTKTKQGMQTVEKSNNAQSADDSNSTAIDSCFRARKDTIPPGMYGNLSTPFINLGFPKMGTSSIHQFFGCAGYKSVHYRCLRTMTCAECTKRSVNASLPPLTTCGASEVYAQLDGNIPMLFFPQIVYLEEFIDSYPNATFILTFRSIEKWFHSIENWPPSDDPLRFKLKKRMRMARIPGLVKTKKGDLQDFSDFFCNHVKRVRKLVPRIRLVEIDIEDPGISSRLADIFDLDEQCWGHANFNAQLHPELINQTSATGGGMPWRIQGKLMLRGKNGVMRMKRPPPPLHDPIDNVNRSETNKLLNTSDIGVEQVQNESYNVESSHLVVKTANNNEAITLAAEAENPQSIKSQRSSWLDNCHQLIAHENGHWHHHDNISHIVDNPLMRQSYYPEELKWLKGQNVPQTGFGKCTRSAKYQMHNSLLGHQCGCGVRGYKPTHSVWVYNTTRSTTTFSEPAPNLDYFAASPTLRLAKKLANAEATLCLSGDSIDYQIYSAMFNNLRRIEQLHKLHHPGKERMVSVVTREIPVTNKYHTKPGNLDGWWEHGQRPPNGDGSFLHAVRPPPGGHGSMYSILETKAHFKDKQSNITKRGRIRYYMSYGWSPWNVDFMEDCTAIVMNIGLHYTPNGDHMGRETRHTLMNDMLSAITYMTNFTASKENRVAVWRSALPQHFATKDGHFYGRKKLPTDGSCTAINRTKHRGWQVYNELYDEAFSQLCHSDRQADEAQSCAHLQHSCSVDPAADVDYQTIYSFWRANNCTEHMERERIRLRNSSSVSGSILRWNVFDIFNVPHWHISDGDCSHFCYLPSLFETAFERLELLISPTLLAQT